MIELLRLVPAFLYPFLAAEKDAMQITHDGSRDSLKERFHAVNVWIRLVFFLPLAFLHQPFLTGVAYLLFSAALHWLLFDLELNKQLNKPLWYVGVNAKSDLFLHGKNQKIIKLVLVFSTGLFYLFRIL